jgi:hypothetical protein
MASGERTHEHKQQNYFFVLHPFPTTGNPGNLRQSDDPRILIIWLVAAPNWENCHSAFDYKRFRQVQAKSSCRLLFVAHREEILNKVGTFQRWYCRLKFWRVIVGYIVPARWTSFISDSDLQFAGFHNLHTDTTISS